MGYWELCGFISVCSGILLLLTKREKELAAVISAMLYVLLALFLMEQGGRLLSEIRQAIPFDAIPHASVLLRCCGVAAIAAVSGGICESAGQKELAKGIEAIAALEVLWMAMPIFTEIVSELMQMLGE